MTDPTPFPDSADVPALGQHPAPARTDCGVRAR